MQRITLLVISILCFSFLSTAQPDIQKQLQTKLIMAEDGETITLDEGVFTMNGTLSMEGKKRVTIKGRGIGKSVHQF